MQRLTTTMKINKSYDIGEIPDRDFLLQIGLCIRMFRVGIR